MVKYTVKQFPDLEETKRFYLSQADEYAEREREQFITPGNGQAMSYEEKHRQALAGGGSMITAEAEALEITEQEVIDSVLAARAQWEQIGAAIEAARLKAKKSIRHANTPADAHNAVIALKVELSGLGGGS